MAAVVLMVFVMQREKGRKAKQIERAGQDLDVLTPRQYFVSIVNTRGSVFRATKSVESENDL